MLTTSRKFSVITEIIQPDVSLGLQHLSLWDRTLVQITDDWHKQESYKTL